MPVDYRDDAPVDEWSGDIGCGVQYFSQQAVAGCSPAAGIEVPAEMPLAGAARGGAEADGRGATRGRGGSTRRSAPASATRIAHYADFYDIESLLVLGRVTSGEGGEVILAGARQVLEDEFPELARADPPPDAGREGQAARPGDRRGEPAGGFPHPREAGAEAGRARRP